VVKRYKKKPVIIQALEWTGDNKEDMARFMGNPNLVFGAMGALCISTLEGEMWAKTGDMIIKGTAGEFYPCKPDIFGGIYEEVQEDQSKMVGRYHIPLAREMYQSGHKVVEAIQYTGNNASTIEKWAGNKCKQSPVLEPTEDNPTGEYMQVDGITGWVCAVVGDYVVKYQDEFYPCAKERFESLYERTGTVW
jgi:hypothetical protein